LAVIALLEDLVFSVPMDRAAATDLVLEYLTNAYWPGDDPWWLHHLVEAVQEEIQEDRINTEWPRCPRHRNHPLWLEEPGGPELWWVCREDGDRVAELGALATCARESGRKVTVMADYGAFPLWFSGGGFMAGRDELPLPADLVDELSRWGTEYGDTLSANGYAWPSTAQRHDWNLRGRVLARLVRASLDSAWEVEFFDQETGGLEIVPPTSG